MLRPMRVRTTIFLLLLFAGTAFVASLYQMRRLEADKFRVATASMKVTWVNSVDEFWNNQGRQLQTMVEKVPNREGVVEAILKNDRDWAAATWDTRTLSSYDAQAIWVYRPDGTLFYSYANTGDGELLGSPLPPDAVAKLYGHERAPVFYFPVKSRIPGHLRFAQVHGAPIWHSWDSARQQPLQGYFLASRIWDDEELSRVLPPDRDKAQFVPLEKVAPADSGANQMNHAIGLRDWQGKDLAQLVFTNESAQLKALEARSDRVFNALIAGAVILFLVLLILLNRAVVHPVHRIIRSLRDEDLSLLASFDGQKSEFARLADLIRAFFTQRAERDATEKALHQSEEMLRHSQKMEAVGRLAGGVAHDFNNLLTAIIGYADVLRQRFATEPAALRPAELIHQAGEQAAGLTRQLLAFSRKQLLQPKVIDLNAIVANLLRLLQRIIGEHIEIVAQPEATRPCVKADPGQIEQVIVNLGVNARDAMPRGGRLVIRTCNLTLDESHAVPDLTPGDYVAIEVTDTGEGMDADTRARIFEPFFTTKGPGKGTGLGLATVYGIVKQSHGGIVVESERGQGSTFRIYLPREDGPVDTVAAAPVPEALPARAESILVVEDEEIVRELVCEILRGHGYHVLATGRGSEALRLLAEEKRGVDLLISDVVMPEMNGALVAQRVREICPRARVLFVSGYSENDMADQGLEELAFQVLQKPFTPDTLARKVREVLDGAYAKTRGIRLS
jgi:signal transduction histidine kinase/CheY-like chemotaxis protein